MTSQDVLHQLEAVGTEPFRKTYRRHGAADPMFGVSSVDLGKLQKKIKTDHALARALWRSGNYDARILATMVADPDVLDARELDSWAADVTCYPLASALGSLAARTAAARDAMHRWTRSDDEWLAYAGWVLLACLARSEESAMQDADFEPYLHEVEHEVHARKNRVRHGMNGALIAIGLRNASLEKRALAIAAKIGKVTVDHGDTACETPDAAAYIAKVKARRKKA
jgi:3-methyladenine DNA glycosylase AlkD